VIDPAELHATEVIYRMPKKDPVTGRKRPHADKKNGFYHKGSHGKKAKMWHP
jgi:hypothetical protein